MSTSSRALRLSHRGVCAALFLLVSGCAGPGHYGFARTYSPLASEQRHFEEARQLNYVDLVREPNAYQDTEIGWFGVVTGLQELPEGRTRLLLTLRTHQTRHLCTDDSRTSCRVTVSDAPLGVFAADLTLTERERAGQDRVWIGSLLKIYGTPSGEYSKETGPVLDVVYHRHWPRGYYVTTAARSKMRR